MSTLDTPPGRLATGDVPPEEKDTLTINDAKGALPQSITIARVVALIIMWVCIFAIGVIKISNIEAFTESAFFVTYSLLVGFFILSRFALAEFYNPKVLSTDDPTTLPTVTFGIPCKNEGDNIRETIVRIANSDYPREKFNIIAINDGSTDNTLAEMEIAQAEAAALGVDVVIVDWEVNRGKRDGMAECVKQSDMDVMIFIDSDSFVLEDTAKQLVKYFAEDKVGAVAGHAYVANPDVNIITKMQEVRYYVAFKAYKAAEGLFGTVTCCSGCCAAYRRDAIEPLMDDWLHQKFLGTQCTYGDDRSLTNAILHRGYTALYAADAISFTFVPDTLRVFMKQQLRWKKSWFRESFLAGRYMWRRHPIMSLSWLVGFLLPIFAPIVVFRAMIWYPIETGMFPWFYVIGLVLMSVVYGLYYRLFTGDRRWIFGTMFAVFYTIALIWQLPYAIATLKDTSWGTR